MPALAFTDQRERLRRILGNALGGASYVASRPEEDERVLVIEARRADGTAVFVRFRGVRRSEASAEPDAGSSLSVSSVGSANRFSVVGLLFPFLRGPGSGTMRVRIEAGAAHLDIVCEDAEWWEEGPNHSGESRP